MRFEIENGEYLGSAEWQGPGRVMVDMADDREREWFESYFSAEDTFLNGSVGDPEMASERRDETEESFMRAAMQLAAYAYKVQRGEGSRWATHPAGKKT